LWRVWYESFFWTAPQYLLGAALAAFIHWVNRYLGWQSSFLVFPIIYLIYRSYRLYLGRLDEEKKHVSAMANLHLRTIEALALAIDAKDETTHSHMRRVQVYATEIAKELGAGEMVIQALQAAALLHDIGKLAVPEYIISKPGRLTPEEFEKMKIHPVVGAEILETVQFPYPVVPVVRSHHEKWDGTGYPDGKKGTEIPLGARILAAVDCLDALASDRQYRRALSLDKAMELIVSESGKSFDPQVVHVLKQRYHELERMAKASSAGLSKLSIKLRVERGQAPDAGFEETGSAVNGQPQHDRADFLGMIAGARQEFQMLLEMTNELGSTLSLDETLSILATRLKNMVPYDAIAIYLRRGEKLVPQYASGENFRLFSSLEIPMGQGLSGWVAENKLPIINGNPSVEPGYLNDPTKFSTMRSALAVPLEGLTEVVGALTLYRSESDAFTKDHLRMLLAISSKAGLTIENAVHHSKIEKSAVTDELTGLPNARSLFLKLDAELARCKRSGAALTVMVLDLDGFKQVNDRFGHLEGNKVLQLTAARLKDSCREYDYVGRMGGDEFVVLLPESDRDALETKAQLFCDIVVAVGHEVCGDEVLSLSVGESFFPHDGSDAEELLAQADKRMYQVKRTHHSSAKLSSEKPVQLALTPAG
jgi:diguanylate cyclase (GGDEF)-like protein/putative nucleotidyltransferase with HDIG domain